LDAAFRALVWLVGGIGIAYGLLDLIAPAVPIRWWFAWSRKGGRRRRNAIADWAGATGSDRPWEVASVRKRVRLIGIVVILGNVVASWLLLMAANGSHQCSCHPVQSVAGATSVSWGCWVPSMADEMKAWWRSVVVRGLISFAIVLLVGFLLDRAGLSPMEDWWAFAVIGAAVYIGLVIAAWSRRGAKKKPPRS
jgi:hypothetical protein